MNFDPHLAIVSGRVEGIDRFEFARFLSEYNPILYSLDYTAELSRQKSPCKHILFGEKDGMQGYMNGLERMLETSKEIVCYETFQLSTFQSIKFAERAKIPVSVIVDDSSPSRFANYKNIRAIQSQVFSKADRFLVSSRTASAALQREGVEPQRIEFLPMYARMDLFANREAARKKFRDHARVGDADQVISFIGSISHDSGVLHFVDAFLHDHRQMLQGSCKVILVGTGDLTAVLKERIQDAGLQGSFRFIQQSISPFSADLIAASDAIFFGERVASDADYQWPEHQIQALLAHVPIFIPDRLIWGDFFSPTSFVPFQASSRQSFSACIESLLVHGDQLQNQARLGSERLSATLGEESIIHKRMVEIFGTSDVSSSGRPSTGDQGQLKEAGTSEDIADRTSLIEIISEADEHMRLHQYRTAVDLYWKAYLMDGRCIAALKGLATASYMTGAYDESLSFYRRALATDPGDGDLYRGLGLLALKANSPTEAALWFKKAWLISAQSHTGLSMMIQACMEADQAKIAIECLESIREFLDDDSTIQLALKRLYDKTNRKV